MRKRYIKKDIEKLLAENNYLLSRIRGSHFIYKSTVNGNTISVNKDLNPMVARRLIKENNLIEM